MDTPFDASFSSADTWDGYMGWVSDGNMYDSTETGGATFNVDIDTAAQASFQESSWQIGPSMQSLSYHSASIPHPELLQWNLPTIAGQSVPFASQDYHCDNNPAGSTSSACNPWMESTRPPELKKHAIDLMDQCLSHSSFSHNTALYGTERVILRTVETKPADSQASARTDPPMYAQQEGYHPRRQAPRFAGDEYAAAWIRGDKAEREGWCGICSSWYRLKDSAYWYHMHYSHGISYRTGRPFDGPLTMRPVKNSFNYELLCGGCNQWLQVARPERWRTPYYRHAYRCQAKLRSEARSEGVISNRSPARVSKK